VRPFFIRRRRLKATWFSLPVPTPHRASTKVSFASQTAPALVQHLAYDMSTVADAGYIKRVVEQLAGA